MHEMIQITARERSERGQTSLTRPATIRHEYRPGDLVDLWRQPLSKGLYGWLGPATIVYIDPNGSVHVKYQGGTLVCRNPDVRPALLYCSYIAPNAYYTPGEHATYDCVLDFMISLHQKEHQHAVSIKITMAGISLARPSNTIRYFWA